MQYLLPSPTITTFTRLRVPPKCWRVPALLCLFWSFRANATEEVYRRCAESPPIQHTRSGRSAPSPQQGTRLSQIEATPGQQFYALTQSLAELRSLDSADVSEEIWSSILLAQAKAQRSQVRSLYSKLQGNNGERWGTEDRTEIYRMWLSNYEEALVGLVAGLQGGEVSSDVVDSVLLSEEFAITVLQDYPDLWEEVASQREDAWRKPVRTNPTQSLQIELLNCYPGPVLGLLQVPSTIGSGDGKDQHLEIQEFQISLNRYESKIFRVPDADTRRQIQVDVATRNGAKTLKSEFQGSLSSGEVLLRIGDEK